MNNHQKRLLIGFGIAVIVLTAFMLVLNKDAMTIMAYFFSLLAPAAFFGSLWMVASGNRSQYITNAAFPLQAHTYAVLNIVICGIFVLADQRGMKIPVGWFILAQLLLLAFFAWRFLTMDSGREEIERVEKKNQIRTVAWKSLILESQAVYQKADMQTKEAVGKVVDAIRYADPMEHEELASSTAEIRRNLQTLRQFLENKQTEDANSLSLQLMDQIKIRNAKCKMLK